MTVSPKPVFAAVSWNIATVQIWVFDQYSQLFASVQRDYELVNMKPAFYKIILEEELSKQKLPAGSPVIMCGMAGSAQGWIDASYVPLPCIFEQLPGKAAEIPDIDWDVRILPGLAQMDETAYDVMRGEETVLLGAFMESKANGLICIPGTHTKWVQLNHGVITRFSTAMTGEVLALLTRSSTLSYYLGQIEGNYESKSAFNAGVKEAIANPERIMHSLFSIRANSLLDTESNAGKMAGRLSGLLIGSEIAGMKITESDSVTLISKGTNSDNYIRAFRAVGVRCEELDSDEMLRSGLYHVARSIWPNLVGSRPINLLEAAMPA